MQVVDATPGARGIDCVTVLDPAHVTRLLSAGYAYAVRYLGGITPRERDAILSVGMGLMLVTYAPKPYSWAPSALLGAQRGVSAVAAARALGVPDGARLWIDFETPALGTTADRSIAHINAATSAITRAGYKAGLYVGYGIPLTAAQLFHDLECDLYWHSCSYVPDVAVRGYAMLQDEHANQMIAGVQVDVNTVRRDALGGIPSWITA